MKQELKSLNSTRSPSSPPPVSSAHHASVPHLRPYPFFGRMTKAAGPVGQLTQINTSKNQDRNEKTREEQRGGGRVEDEEESRRRATRKNAEEANLENNNQETSGTSMESWLN